MSVLGIRDAIKTALETITGLTAYDNVPETIPSDGFPLAMVYPLKGTFHEDFSGQMGHEFEITLLVGQCPGLAASAQDALDGYLSESGTGSVVAAVEAATLSTHGDAIVVTGYNDYGFIQFKELTYWGVRFGVQVST